MSAWRLAFVRMLQPNPDLAAETCEWIIAAFLFVLIFGSGFVLGRIL